MNRIIIISLLLFIIVTKGYSAEKSSTINGTVINSEKGVPFVAVYVKGSANGSITDATGNFSIEVPADDMVVLGIKGLGYKTTYKEIKPEELFFHIYINIEEDLLLLEQVVISGSRVGLLRYLPGSANIIISKDIESIAPLSGNDVLRNISGLHVVEEEGAGLRLNVGVRGLDPDKSRNVLILEDGIPVALAPYGEPEMYFTPSIDRMSGVEVLKGSGSILFGPQTIGGVINYLTADPPENREGKLTFRGGDKGFYNMQLEYGNTIDNFGYKIDFQRKQAENFGPTAFVFHDLNIKMLINISPISKIAVKAGFYDENSNSTYVGQTQPMYNSGLYDDLRIAPDDNLHIRRYAASITHKYNPLNRMQINTNAFAYTTVRNWNRQDFTYNTDASNLTGVMHGVENEDDGAIYLRNTTGQRNRQFEVAGIEPRLSYYFDVINMQSKIDAGLRYLYEKTYEQRVVGSDYNFASGDLRDDEVRHGNTLSSYIQNKLLLNDRLTVTAGLRNENIWYEREIMRINYTDTLIVANTSVFSFIPGAGINYEFSSNIGLFGGIHRGFAPPRTKDAISSSGEDMLLDAEKSWNSELGLRFDKAGIRIEYTMFYMDFSNQIIPVSESSGGLGTGYINGGSTLHKGMEMNLEIPVNNLTSDNWNIKALLAGTYVQSEFSGDRFVLMKTALKEELEDVYTNVKGNRTPYSPQFTGIGAIIIEYRSEFGMRLSSNYAGSQYTDVLNTDNVYEWIETDNNDSDYRYVQATANGRVGKLDPYFVANISLWYNHSSGLGFNFSVYNIFNERYIVTRRPQGIRTGMPRFFNAGIVYSF